MKILITGGNGFLGKRLGKAMKSKGHEVILASRNNKQNLTSKEFSGCNFYPLDVTNIESIRDAVLDFQPNVVIHAAATKFVDLAEKIPNEAIDINVIGSQNIARVAVENKLDLVIGISTDKASPPVANIYGLTKSLMERLFCSLNRDKGTKFLCVRFGNIAWSTGSVLPIWKKMAEDKGIIGTTGPNMYRFFFTVDEAAELVLTAFNNKEELFGKVISREMKAAKLKDILDVWKEEKGIKVENLPERPSEREDEFLIGDTELEYSTEVTFNNLKHFILDFSNKSKSPLKHSLSAKKANKLNRTEILSLINNPPEEEK